MPTQYLVSQVEGWREELAALPPPDPGRRKVGKHQAVIMMAKELQAAARQGYTARELLEVLAAKGLQVHLDTVREALRKARRTAGPGPTRARRRDGDGNGSAPVLPAVALGEDVAAVAGGENGERHRQPDGDDAVTVPAPAGGAVAATTEAGPEEDPALGGRADDGRRGDGGASGQANDGRPDEETGASAPKAAKEPARDSARHAAAVGGKDPGAGARGSPGKHEPLGESLAGSSRPSTPPARGRFVPRNDSDDI
jgi:hypothetical protein